MSAVRHSRTRLAPAPTTAKVRQSRTTLTGVGAAAGKVRHARSRVTGTAPAAAKVRHARSQMTGSVAVVVNPIPDLIRGPGETINVTATLSAGGTAQAWQWRVVSGPTILLPTGPTLNVQAPSVLATTTTPLVIGVQATVGGSTSPEVTFTVTLYPQLEWTYSYATQIWTGMAFAPA